MTLYQQNDKMPIFSICCSLKEQTSNYGMNPFRQSYFLKFIKKTFKQLMADYKLNEMKKG